MRGNKYNTYREHDAPCNVFAGNNFQWLYNGQWQEKGNSLSKNLHIAVFDTSFTHNLFV